MTRQIPEIVWLKYNEYLNPDNTSVKTYWKLYDISKFRLVTNTNKYGYYRQYLEFKWSRDDGSHGVDQIELKDYPPLASKEHLILLCNIERPYDEERDIEYIVRE